jgi:TPP-dependent 2-oxoacid decarboxylase
MLRICIDSASANCPPRTALLEVSLSPLNGVSRHRRILSAFSEMVPVLHLVGVPSTAQQKTRPILHHTLGDGRFVIVVSSSNVQLPTHTVQI